MSQIAKHRTPPKNYIINGAFDLFQRSLDVSGIGNGATFIPDRFGLFSQGSQISRVFKSTEVPTFGVDNSVLERSGFQPEASLRIAPTTINASPGVTDAYAFFHRFEGYDLWKFGGGWVTLSFCVKANKTGIYSVNLFTADGATAFQTYTTEYEILASDVWQYVEIPIPLTSDILANTNKTNVRALEIAWVLMVGDDRKTSVLNQWQPFGTLATLASPNQVNGADNTSNEWRMTNVALHRGTRAGFFERAGGSFGAQLALAQRYYEKSYNLDVEPGSVGAGHIEGAFIDRALGTTVNGVISRYWSFASTKRATPTVTTYATDSGTPGKIRDTTANADRNSAAGSPGVHGVYMRDNESVVDGNFHRRQATADAEL